MARVSALEGLIRSGVLAAPLAAGKDLLCVSGFSSTNAFGSLPGVGLKQFGRMKRTCGDIVLRSFAKGRR